MKFTNQSNNTETLAERIEDAMGFRSKVESISLGIKLGILTAVLTALYFFIFSVVSFDNYVLTHLSKFFVIGAIMFIGFVLFRPRKNTPTFGEGIKLAATITIVSAVSFFILQALLTLIGGSAYLEPEMYRRAIEGGADQTMTSYVMFFISFVEIVIYGLIAGIANILYFTKPLKTSKNSFNKNQTIPS